MPLKFALIGAGSIGRIHAKNIAANKDTELSVVCDTNVQAAKSLSVAFGGTVVSAMEDALDEQPDAVIIASSTASHGDVASACILTGTPFLCEKPLASNLESALEIAESAKVAGIAAATAFNRRFDPGYSGIRDAVLSGEIGRAETVIFTSRTASPPTIEFTRTSGGLFGEKGAHFYDLARWITGEDPVELSAMGSAIVNPDFEQIGEVDTALITMKMPSGTLCQFDFSWRATYGQDERIEVNGSKGMLRSLQQPVGPFIKNSAIGQMHAGLMPTWYERFARTYEEELAVFVEVIQGGDRDRLATLEDGCMAQRIADAAKSVVNTGRSVFFSDPATH